MEMTTTAAAPVRLRYLPQLDGLRAIAVLAVVLFHARASLLPGGYIGVDIFFVLSGFLITQIIVQEVGSNGRFSFRRFYVRRALRLFPALFFAGGVLALLYWLVPELPDREASLAGTAGAVTYSSSWLAAFQVVDLGNLLPTWSLSVEEHFYLFWPILLIFGLKTHPRHPWLAPTLLAFGVVYPVAMHFLLGWDQSRLYYAPDTRAGQLLIGCATALLLPKLRRPMNGVFALLAAIALLVYGLCSEAFVFDIYSTLGIILVPVLAAALVAYVASVERGHIHWVRSCRPMVWIGQRSYGIYLWNLPLIGALWFLGSSPSALIAKAAVCILVPAISYALIEKPFLSLKQRMH